jgi:periplasmic divalent cation tolerance protein
MSIRELVWVVVNTNSTREADKIGRAVLKARLCACYALIPRIKSVYYWPPGTSKLEVSKGPLLTLETLPRHYNQIVKLVKKLHSDKVPFIGQWEMEEVDKNFYSWLKKEIK